MKGLARFALIWALTMLLTPYVNRWLNGLAARVPRNSFLEEMLGEVSGRYSAPFIRSVGETIGELVLGPRSR